MTAQKHENRQEFILESRKESLGTNVAFVQSTKRVDVFRDIDLNVLRQDLGLSHIHRRSFRGHHRLGGSDSLVHRGQYETGKGTCLRWHPTVNHNSVFYDVSTRLHCDLNLPRSESEQPER